MKTRLCIGLSILTVFVATMDLLSQEKIYLWKKGLSPNSRIVPVNDSVSNQRMYRVSAPYIQVFEPEKAKKNGTSVLIIPGGSYARLAFEVSGTAIARWLNREGITAYVLYYRLPQQKNVEVSYLAPLQDAQRAIKIIRARGKNIDADKMRIGVLGTSAGGHVAAGLCTMAYDWALCGDSLDTETRMPDFAVLISPVISMADSVTHRESKRNLLGNKAGNEEIAQLYSADCQVGTETPPAILIHAANDKGVAVANSIAYFNALIKNGINRSSLHIFPQGGHSISMEKQPGSTQTWSELVIMWMKENHFTE